MKPMTLGLIFALCATAAFASSEDSWAALEAAATKACRENVLKRYGPDPSAMFGVAGHISGIGGAGGDGYYAVVIERTARLGKDLWICLYDKQAKAVSAGLVQMHAR